MVERLCALGSPALAQFNAWLRRETLPGIFSAKSRDELQAVIAVLRKAEDLDLPLQFLNFRD